MEGDAQLSRPLIECVPNFSEGRDTDCIDAIEAAIAAANGSVVLHRTSDPDHNRSVITYAGTPESVLESAVRAAEVARDRIDLNLQSGVHPRVGAMDVLPFVPLEGATLAECVEIAHAAGRRIWDELQIPVYFYEAAAWRPERMRLEDVRRGEFEALRTAGHEGYEKRPDVGGPALHPTAGAVIAGARKLLIAFNVNLQSTDVSLAKSIAKRIRASSGGFRTVKALGLPLASRGLVQVSTNVTDFEVTSVAVVYREIEHLAHAAGVAIEESELIGLIPQRALEGTSPEELKMKEFDAERILENRLRSCIAGSGKGRATLP
ncbi:MAG: glutamate formimidoyltransferase [Acidobacteriaceae bacterium]|nr:glutamate formimidoyltransferase [Acidobacteriaceae bacterium]